MPNLSWRDEIELRAMMTVCEPEKRPLRIYHPTSNAMQAAPPTLDAMQAALTQYGIKETDATVTMSYRDYAALVRRAEDSELHLGDFKEATRHWCNEANRNRRAFIGASILAGVMTLAFVAEGLMWWLR